MALSLWIPSALQYGAPDPGEVRQGALRRALTQSLKRHLFEERTAAAQSSQPVYERVLNAFSGKLKAELTIGPQWALAAQCWQVLCQDTPAPVTPHSESEPQQPAAEQRIEALFGLTLHALCAVLADEWLAHSHSDQDADLNEATLDEDKDSPDTLPGTEQARVVNALSTQLPRATWSWQGDIATEDRADTNTWRVIARLLLDTLLDSLGDWFSVCTGDTHRQGERAHTEKRIEVRDPALQARIDRLLQIWPLQLTAQPLRAPVAYDSDAATPAETDSCLRINLIGYRQTNAFLRETHSGLRQPTQRPPEFARYVEAVNFQQAVPWRVNTGVLTWTRALIAALEEGPAATGLAPAARDELRAWVRKHLYRPGGERPNPWLAAPRDRDRRRARPAEFLDHPLARKALDALCPKDPQTAPPAFYLPWKADYRGRIYAETTWLTPQGGDLQRALLELGRGQVLTKAGARALRCHGANLVKRARLLTDLEITDRAVIGLEERERWVRDHEAHILASASAPLAEPFWREVADKPMQFLAFCLAYRQWRQHPEVPVHLPVQIDGTCNGLQHIAALTGNQALARAVNVLPRDQDDRPADIYSELAEAARQTLGRLSVSKDQSIHRHGLEMADAWLAANPTRQRWLARATAKKVVMTIPYGASHGAQARGVLEALEDDILEAWRQDAPPLAELDALLAWRDDKASVRRKLVTRSTRDLFDDLRRRAFAGDDELVQHLARAEWERLRTLAAYVALALVEHLHLALDRTYPGVRTFADWLDACAKACVGTARAPGLPLLWLTPLGFPVVQSGFQIKRTGTSPRLGARQMRIDVRVMLEEVDPGQQCRALLPGLIHSLDATHLALTLLAAQARGVQDLGSIHDCLLCHPNAADVLSETVRATFAELYAPDATTGEPAPLSDWSNWMQQVTALRRLPRRAEVLGALEHPGGLGERTLDNDAETGRQEAREARAALEALRCQPPPQRFLLGRLLQRAARLATPNQAPVIKRLAGATALPLRETGISRHFFS